MLFRFLITIGSMFGFVTGALDLLERFGVPVDSWLRALPGLFSDVFAWFGLQVDRVTVAIFGAPEPVMMTRSGSGEAVDFDSASADGALYGADSETLIVSGLFTLIMFMILVLTVRSRAGH